MKSASKVKERLKFGLYYAGLSFKPGCDPRNPKYQALEALVPAYQLPDPLVLLDGCRVEDAKTWREARRPELLDLFRTHVYGRAPPSPPSTTFEVLSDGGQALDGAATRKEIRVFLTGQKDGPSMQLLVYLPRGAVRQGTKVPVFLGLNRLGNHTVHADPAISITTSWIPFNMKAIGRPRTKLRGLQASQWQVEFLLGRGYGLATAYYGDIVPDRKDGLDLGINAHLRRDPEETAAPDTWGAIGGWAWGLSRAMDYLEKDPDVDACKVAVIGHSRLGKAALWAGAQDERFAMAISNDSGRAGAALSKREFGETVAMSNLLFPYWYCDNYKRYNNDEKSLPVDQHELISLIAPRPVYVASAQQNLHADPMGEFLGAKHANPVYRLLGAEGLPADEMPPVNAPVMGTIGYHMRTGKHDVTRYDWEQFLAFADKHFNRGK